MRLSKTARNLNKVFLTCGVPHNREEQRPKAPPCKYFPWIHTALYPLPSDPVLEWLLKFAASHQPRSYKLRPLKSVNKTIPDQQKKSDWFQQAAQNVNQWNQDQANKTWMNQFSESARKQKTRTVSQT